MPIDFIMVEKSKKVNYHKGVSLGFPHKIHAYMQEHKDDFPSGITILTNLDDFGDRELTPAELSGLSDLCTIILSRFESTADFTIYDKLKTFNIKKDEFVNFISGFSQMINHALNNNKTIYSVGE